MKHPNIHLAASMLGEGMLDTAAMRPYINSRGEPCVVINGQSFHANAALLRYDEWKDLDAAVLKVATDSLIGIADLMSAGLTHNLGNIGITVSQWDKESDMTGANIDMSGVTEGEEDTVAYDQDSVPVPVVHKDFRLNIRRLSASRRMGEALDVTGGRIAARKVSEASEDMLFAGTPITMGGGTIYGYTNYPSRNQVDMATPWDEVAQANNDTIVNEVITAIEAAKADNYNGPFTLYYPRAYWGKLQEEYTDGYPKTVAQRIREIDGIAALKQADRLTGDNVVLVQLTSEVVDLAIAQDITTVSWDSKGGMVEHFKTMAVWVPRLKRDYDGRSGIVHLRPAASE